MKKPVVDLLFEKALVALKTNRSIEDWANSAGIRLYSNQVEIINTILKEQADNITILAARSAGKTYSVALAMMKLCIDNPGYSVIFFAPKQAQSTRILDQIRRICDRCKDTLAKEIDWEHSNQNKYRFYNGSFMISLSSASSNQEGFHCFTKGTLITLADGSKKPVEEISIGDVVLSRNKQTDALQSNMVLATGSRIPDEPLYEVSYEINGEVKTLRCTGSHKFYTKNRSEVQAKALTDGDQLISTAEANVIGVRKLDTIEPVYNFTVAEDHNYFANDVNVSNCDCAVLDESHQIDTDFYNTKISPMLKAAVHPKVIKIGITVGRNHFYESCNNPTWTHLVYPWDKCPNLYNAGTIMVDGVAYPKTIINDMPLSYKKARFPNHPELHFPSENNIDEDTFDTQYEMKWIDSRNTFLTEQDLEDMVGDHPYMMHGVDGEDYYFGLDLAGGLLINQGLNRDYSSLVIVRKLDDGMKQVVHCEEWQGDIVEQMEDMVAWIHPQTGRFKCRFGTADYGSLGPAVVDMLIHSGIKIAGIRYRSSEPTTGMPYKTAIFDNLFTELRNGYFKYPDQHAMLTNYLLKKHMEEWQYLERKVNTNGNVQIAAPQGTTIHDDCCNATCLAVWAADRMQEELRRLERNRMSAKMCSPILSGYTTANRFSRQTSMPSHIQSLFGGKKR